MGKKCPNHDRLDCSMFSLRPPLFSIFHFFFLGDRFVLAVVSKKWYSST